MHHRWESENNNLFYSVGCLLLLSSQRLLASLLFLKYLYPCHLSYSHGVLLLLQALLLLLVTLLLFTSLLLHPDVLTVADISTAAEIIDV
jgi:hypothetical protein